MKDSSGLRRPHRWSCRTGVWPDMLEYEKNTDRPFSVIVLEPETPLARE
jgi:hypothetical protein